MGLTGARRPRPWHLRRAPRPAETFAALDLGTNNCRLLVARPDAEGFRVVDAFSRIVRLGEGVSRCGHLSEPAMARAIEALRVCADKIRRWHVQRSRAVATEACRRATNCSEFVERVRDETGLELEIIDCQEEARLSFVGCAPLIDPTIPRALMFDIGGGSTEITWLEIAPDSHARVIDVLSLPLGVVTLAEDFGGECVPPECYEAMVDVVATLIAPFEQAHGIAAHVESGEVQMVGSSGTVTTLAGVHLDLPRYERARVDGVTLSFEEIDGATRRLAALDHLRRAAHPCIGRDRADLVLAGCAILEAICRQWPVGRLRVADRGVREGILLGMMGSRRGAADAAS
jgi:exopolyphosphatase/guanosine-5'-triphosphate,3'-diphosphate pyrophosphatase